MCAVTVFGDRGENDARNFFDGFTKNFFFENKNYFLKLRHVVKNLIQKPMRYFEIRFPRVSAFLIQNEAL